MTMPAMIVLPAPASWASSARTTGRASKCWLVHGLKLMRQGIDPAGVQRGVGVNGVGQPQPVRLDTQAEADGKRAAPQNVPCQLRDTDQDARAGRKARHAVQRRTSTVSARSSVQSWVNPNPR